MVNCGTNLKRKSGGYHDHHALNKRPKFDHNGNVAGTEKPLLEAPQIKDAALEKAVFTHPFYGAQERERFVTYDRLEFYGDAEIERMATRLVWKTYEALPAGKMSQIREHLVKNETLSKFTIMYGFDERLRATHPPDLFRDPKDTQKIYGDVFEAYIAAVVLSDPEGYTKAENWLHGLWASKLQDSAVTNLVSSGRTFSKQDLATKILGKGARIEYKDERAGVIHKGKGIETYYVGAYFTGYGWQSKHLGSGSGLSKTAAGDKAAAEALKNPLIAEIAVAKAEDKKRSMEENERLAREQHQNEAHG